MSYTDGDSIKKKSKYNDNKNVNSQIFFFCPMRLDLEAGDGFKQQSVPSKHAALVLSSAQHATGLGDTSYSPGP